MKRNLLREITAEEFAAFSGTKVRLQVDRDFFKRPENRELWLLVLNHLRIQPKPGEPGYGGNGEL